MVNRAVNSVETSEKCVGGRKVELLATESQSPSDMSAYWSLKKR